MHLPVAAAMSSEDDGTDRAARAERELAPALPSRLRRRPKVNRWVEHYILKGVTDALFLDIRNLGTSE